MNAPENDPARWNHPDFILLKLLGRGGMGSVYLARHRSLGTEHALKICNAPLEKPEDRLRFDREAQVLGRLRHPNIIEINHYGVWLGQLFFVMPLLKGKDLAELLAESLRFEGRPLSWRVAVPLISSIAQALAYCHEQGIIHRDVKSTNIFVRDDREAILVDFGIAKRATHGDQEFQNTLSRSSVVMGSLCNLSPEQLHPKGGFGPLSVKVDTWGLGVVIFEALTGAVPFRGANVLELFETIRTTDRIPRISDQIKDCPSWLDQLCAEMLSRQAEDRPAMAEVHQRLRDGLREAATTSPSQTVPAAPAKRSRLALLFSVLLLPPLSVGLTALALHEAPRPKLIEPPQLPRITNTSSLVARGRLSLPAVTIKAGAVEAQTDASGAFLLELSLLPGPQRINLSCGEESLAVFEVTLDETPPRLIFDESDAEDEVSLSADEEGQFTARVVDDYGPVRVFVGGEPCELDENGVFHFSQADLSSLDESALLIMACDEAGNTDSISLSLAASPLLRRSQWLKANREEQDQAIRRVARALRAVFDFVDTQNFQCGGRGHRIARFRHGQTGLMFHLLPGDQFEMGILDPEDELYYLYVERGLDPKPVRPDDAKRWLKQSTPMRRVTIPPFLMSATEISRAAWERGARNAPPPDGDMPQGSLNRGTVRAWLKNFEEGLRLPSEAEWEYACLAGSSARYPWGEFLGNRRMQILSSGLRPVTRTDAAANAFGLIDMIGNAYEVVADDWRPDFSKGRASAEPFLFKENSELAFPIRGGACNSGLLLLNPRARMACAPNHEDPGFGARLAYSLPDEY